MIILTGSDGFIGKHFKNSLESGQQLILPVDVDNAFNFLEQFNRWDEVSMIIPVSYTHLRAHETS